MPRFYDSVARHIRTWLPAPVAARADEQAEDLAATVENLKEADPDPGRVVREGTVDGRHFSNFENGSIEIETTQGTRWFKDLTALQAFVNKLEQSKRKDAWSAAAPRRAAG